MFLIKDLYENYKQDVFIYLRREKSINSLECKDKIIVTHYDNIMNEGNKITILGEITKEFETIDINRYII